MITNTENYKQVLPEKYRGRFLQIAGSEIGIAIIFKDQIFRWAKDDES